MSKTLKPSIQQMTNIPQRDLLPESSNSAHNKPASVIFATTNNGTYGNKWLSEENSGTRSLHWCGQTRGAEDHLVVKGTQVWTRNNAKHLFFDYVGDVQEIRMLTPNDPMRHGSTNATYEILVKLRDEPLRIQRAEGDRYTHWNVLKYIGIRPGSLHFPRGIYSNA